MVLRDLEDLRASRGFLRLHEIADEIAWQNYNRLLAKAGDREDAYYKGQIAGLESLFQNFSNVIEEFQEYIEDTEKSMSDGGEEDGN